MYKAMKTQNEALQIDCYYFEKDEDVVQRYEVNKNLSLDSYELTLRRLVARDSSELERIAFYESIEEIFMHLFKKFRSMEIARNNCAQLEGIEMDECPYRMMIKNWIYGMNHLDLKHITILGGGMDYSGPDIEKERRDFIRFYNSVPDQDKNVYWYNNIRFLNLLKQEITFQVEGEMEKVDEMPIDQFLNQFYIGYRRHIDVFLLQDNCLPATVNKANMKRIVTKFELYSLRQLQGI